MPRSVSCKEAAGRQLQPRMRRAATTTYAGIQLQTRVHGGSTTILESFSVGPPWMQQACWGGEKALWRLGVGGGNMNENTPSKCYTDTYNHFGLNGPSLKPQSHNT